MAIEKKITDILTSIDNDEYTIPEFQRGFVWNSTLTDNDWLNPHIPTIW